MGIRWFAVALVKVEMGPASTTTSLATPLLRKQINTSPGEKLVKVPAKTSLTNMLAKSAINPAFLRFNIVDLNLISYRSSTLAGWSRRNFQLQDRHRQFSAALGTGLKGRFCESKPALDGHIGRKKP